MFKISILDKFKRKRKVTAEELGVRCYEMARRSAEELINGNLLELENIETKKSHYINKLTTIFMFTVIQVAPTESESTRVFDRMHQTYLCLKYEGLNDEEFNKIAELEAELIFSSYKTYFDVIDVAKENNGNYIQYLIRCFMKELLGESGSEYSAAGMGLTSYLISTMKQYSDTLNGFQLKE